MLPLPLKLPINHIVVRVLLATTFLWLSAFTFFKYTLWRDPHSAFFKSDHVYDLDYSAFRQEQAVSYIRAADHTEGSDDSANSIPSSSSSPPNPSNVTLQAVHNDPTKTLLCAAFVTIKRAERQYLEESLGSMLEGLTDRERKSLYLYLLFANGDANVHPSWNRPWVSKLTDAAGTYELPAEELARVRDAENRRDWHEKGLYDYLYVMEQCMNNTNAAYIGVFEDDIVFAEGWMARSLEGLADIKQRQHMQQHKGAAKGEKGWLYMRLFYTETSLMWRPEDFWYRNMPFAFFVASSCGAVLLFGMRKAWPKSRPLLGGLSIAAVCFVTIPAFMALLYMVGKYNIKPLKGVVEMNKYGCCTQGLIFPREEVDGLIHYLRGRGRGQTDSMIEEYADETGLTRYALAPQLIQHIGRYSSRDNDATMVKSTWAFWFETYKPRKLKAEHERALSAIDWSQLGASW